MGYLITGLVNPNASLCYLNSVIQFLLTASEFNEIILRFVSTSFSTEFLENLPKKDQYAKCNLIYVYCLLLMYLRDPLTAPVVRHLANDDEPFLSISKLHEALVKIRPDLMEFHQHDVHEVFGVFMNTFQEILFELGKKNNDQCEIHPDNLFQGLQSTSFICDSCLSRNTNRETFNELTCIIQNNDLNTCIQELFKPERIDEYTCDKCNQKSGCTRQYTIEKLPKYLVIHLQRNQFNGNGLINTDPIVFVPVLKVISEYFKWMGAIEHHGRYAHFGHYTSCINMNNNCIVHINDENVRVDKQTMHHFHPYLLIYERISSS
jgi:ubiquitin C-terminal hydrolase